MWIFKVLDLFDLKELRRIVNRFLFWKIWLFWKSKDLFLNLALLNHLCAKSLTETKEEADYARDFHLLMVTFMDFTWHSRLFSVVISHFCANLFLFLFLFSQNHFTKQNQVCISVYLYVCIDGLDVATFINIFFYKCIFFKIHNIPGLRPGFNLRTVQPSSDSIVWA